MNPQRIPFTHIARHVCRGRTPVLNNAAQIAQGVNQAYAMMCIAPWVRVEPLASTMPPHNNGRDGTPNDSYDAHKYCADANLVTWSQHIYAGCVCYVLRLPKDAWEPEAPASAAEVLSVNFNVAADRWIGTGCRAFAVASPDEAPSIRPDELLATVPPSQQSGVLLDQEPPSNENEERNLDVEIQFPQSTAAPKYVHVYLILDDYRTFRNRWVEGSATIDFVSLAVAYDRAIADDVPGGPGEPIEPGTHSVPMLSPALLSQPFASTAYVKMPTTGGDEQALKTVAVILSIMGLSDDKTINTDTPYRIAGFASAPIQSYTALYRGLAYAFAIADPGKRVRKIRFPFPIYRNHGERYRLTIYATDGLVVRQASGANHFLTSIADAELDNPELWNGLKTSATFYAPTATSQTATVQMSCIYSRPVDEPLAATLSASVELPGDIDYTPAGPIVGLLILVSMDTPPTAGNFESLNWGLGYLENGRLIQED